MHGCRPVPRRLYHGPVRVRFERSVANSSPINSRSTADLGRQQKILHRLTQDAGGQGADARAVAEAALRLWIAVARELALLIGQGGVRAIYARSLHLARSSYPWLPEAADAAQSDPPFTELRVSLERQAAPDALEAATAFLVTLTDLLATLIGEALTTGLMNSAWLDRAPGPAAKEPEQ